MVPPRIYLNTRALNRPFDDGRSVRVRREAEAVLFLIEAVGQGLPTLIRSAYLEFEADRNPDRERAQRVASLLDLATLSVSVSESIVSRARELEAVGLRGLDAMHVASAEAAAARLLVTTDDRLLRRAARADLKRSLVVVDPVAAVAVLDPELRQ